MIIGTQAVSFPAQAPSAADRFRSSTRLLSEDRGWSVASQLSDRPEAQLKPADNDPHPVDQPKIRLAVDLLIRLLGLLGIGLSAGACLWLYRLLHAVPAPGPTVGQYVLATVSFLGASVGSGLLFLGGHIYDRIEIAERYRRRW